MKDTNYFTVQSWMVTKLGLKGADRDVFAIIFGFTQDNDSECKCGYKYMTEITGYSKPTIIDAIDRLIEQNLVLKIKSENVNDMRNHYKCNHELVDIILNDEGGKATLPPLVKPLNPPSKATLPHNISENNNKLRKAPAEPTLSFSTKSRKRNMIYGQRDSLVDDLGSGKDITEFEASKKMKPAERFKKNSLAMIESLPYDDETKKLLVDYFNFASTSKNVRRIKDIDLWTSKLDDLASLVKEGYNSADIVRQSLEKKKYVFYPLESVSNNSQYNNQSNKFETGNVIPTQMTHEEILAEKQRRLDAGAKIY